MLKVRNSLSITVAWTSDWQHISKHFLVEALTFVACEMQHCNRNMA